MSEGRILIPDFVEREVTEVRKRARERLSKIPTWKVILSRPRREEFATDGEYYEFLLMQEEARRQFAIRVVKTSAKILWKATWFLLKTTVKLAYIFVLALFSRRAAKFALVRLFVRMV